jgi:protein-S-isoprenylcysteine O-methyltransferase Ste14
MIESILILTASMLLWAALHSLLASAYVKEYVHSAFGHSAERWYRLIYVILSIVTLLPVLALLATLPDQTLYAVPAPWKWAMRGVQGMAVAGLAVAFWETGPFDFLGLAQLRPGQSPGSAPLRIRGMHCWVRHPLYTLSILLIWMAPTMTVNWFITYLFATLYLYIGSLHEETRLVAEFGQAYEDYQKQVPHLLPRPGRCYQPTTLS